MPEGKEFLGVGWSFPPTFRNSNVISESGLILVAGKEDIEQSLFILFNTTLGERVMQPLYGCNLKDFQFEPVTSTLIGSIEDMVRKAILYFEARIILDGVNITKADSFEAMQGYLKISIDYTIRSSNSRFNYVYDFYVREGGIQGTQALQFKMNG
jgi:phage baseplate assembly protein W